MDGMPEALRAAHDRSLEWLESLPTRRVPATASVSDVRRSLGDLPDGPTPPAEVIELLAAAAEPGLVAIPSGRFFGFVMGGTLPAALAADWLVGAWDQNAGLREVTRGTSAIEECAADWLLDLLGLPPQAAVGFVTGATMANFTCLAAARDDVLRRAGWDVAGQGLVGSPGVRVLVGEERHDTVDLALRYLGLGTPTPVPADEQGRIEVEALATALEQGEPMPTVVVLQAGNVHSGGFDDFSEAVALAHRHGAWVHVDGAFGLWAAASPRLQPLTEGVAGADSWATDAHKTLNAPYDCGLAIVRDLAAVRASMGLHADYLVHSEQGEPFEKVPELSRRAREVPVWAALRQLGRQGVTDLVDRLAGNARLMADGLRELGAEVVNDVVFTQVCAGFGDDARTQEVVRRVLEEGATWISGSRWHGRAVLRVSMSNWSTTEEDIQQSLDSVRRALEGL